MTPAHPSMVVRNNGWRWILAGAVCAVLLLALGQALVLWSHEAIGHGEWISIDGDSLHLSGGPVEWLAAIVGLVIAGVVLLLVLPVVLGVLVLVGLGVPLLLLMCVLAVPLLLVGLLLLPLLLPLWLLWKLLA